MQEATIKVEFVNEPDKNPDFGSVKADGKYWGVPKNMLSQFEKGQTYTIGYTTTEGRNGKTFYNVKELRSHKQTTNGGTSPHNNGNGKDQHMISALALYNHSFPIYAARLDGQIDRTVMGNFLFECMLAVDWGLSKHKKFWQQKAIAAAAPKPEIPFDDPVSDIL
ncbi:MAG TPA: hypothetical protein VFA65_24550 [Bryobacteraceae bacterium]|nr:hypothetical protein [Bryobacteraceae bacterium]